MKKLIIILSFFCLFPFMVLGEVVVTTDCSDDDIFCGLAIDTQLFGYVETNYPIPEPFGIKLGQKLDTDIIVKADGDSNKYFDVNPKSKNNMFDKYMVQTEFNNVIAVWATGFFSKEVCQLRRDFLFIKLLEKYGGAYYSDKTLWKFVQATKIVYNKDLVEWVEDFEINLQCNDGTLLLRYFLEDGMLNYNGID